MKQHLAQMDIFVLAIKPTIDISAGNEVANRVACENWHIDFTRNQTSN